MSCHRIYRPTRVTRYVDTPGDLQYKELKNILSCIACSQSADWEYKNVTFCLTDGQGNYYTKELCREYRSGELINESVIWHYPDGSQAPDPPAGVNLIPCSALDDSIDVPVCDPG